MSKMLIIGSQAMADQAKEAFPDLKVQVSSFVPKGKCYIMEWCDDHDAPWLSCEHLHDVVRVDYYKIKDMELAQRSIDGWAYYTGGIPLSIGDIVLVPPTPFTRGKPTKATVLHLDSGGITPRKTIIRRLDSWDEEEND